MGTMYLIPPIKSDEPYVGGFGDIPSKYMIVIPEAPLTPNGLFPSSKATMDRVTIWREAHLKSVYITPLVKHRRSATAKTLYMKDMRYWLPVLYQEIDLIRPERILVMGKFASKMIIPRFINMADDHGTLFTTKGSEIDESLSHLDDMVLVPTFSLNDLQSNLLARPYFQNDMKRFSYLEVDVPEWTVSETLSEIKMPENGSDITIDVETGGFDLESEMHMVGVGYDEEVFIVHHPKPDDIAHFMENINNSGSKIVFHNATFDLAHLIRSSEMRAPMPKKQVGDVMVRAHISGVQNKGLKHLTSLHTDLPGPHSGGRFYDEQYLAEDIRSTLALKDLPQLNRAKGTYADDLYHDLAPIFVDMRLRGVYLNRDKILEILVTSEQALAKATDRLNAYVPSGQEINWNSSQQVVELMLNFGVNLTAETKNGALSVAEGVLEELLVELREYDNQFQDQIDIIEALLEYRGLAKLVSGFLRSYLDLIDENGFIFPNLKLLGTETGRLSCADPNLQQIPRVGDFKLAFEPRWNDGRYTTPFAPGYYGLVDFAGAELRTAAIVSGDRQMAEFILSGDPHSYMARLAFPNDIPQDATIKRIKEEFAGYRKASKKTTFAQMYGGSIKGIAHKNSLPIENVQAVKDALMKYCPDLMRWIERTKAQALQTYRSSTLFGNQRDLTAKFLYEGKGGVERAAINMPAQGGAGVLALIVLRKMHNLCIEKGLVSRPIFGVHDSVLSEIAEPELEIYSRLTQEAYLDIENSPIVDYPVYQMLGIEGDLEIGRNWANCESTNKKHVNILHSIPCDSRGIPNE